jgi:phosphoribosylformimino-5-aminoimidazole carboxamide ribotide isomerase
VLQFVNWAHDTGQDRYDSAMHVIPVIDLMNGSVVRGVAGRRSQYRRIESCIAADAGPATIARAFVNQFAFGTAYVADLNAIMHNKPDLEAWKQISDAGLRLWLDAGVGNARKARCVLDAVDQAQIDAAVVVGLESIESEDELRIVRQICAPRRTIFSLDMQNGQPLTRNAAWTSLSPLDLVKIAIAAGLDDVIVLDLADVGTSQGTRTLELCRTIQNATETKTIIAGGGVRGITDLEALAAVGCNAALVASALHDGRLTPEDIRRINNLPS